MSGSEPVGADVVAVGLEKHYGEGETLVRAVAGVDLHIPAGQFVGIMGPSGSGKSTLMHLLAGLETPSFGTVRIGDVPISELNRNEAARFRRRHLGVVFQFFNLVPSLTVEENVALPLLLEGYRLHQLRDRVDPLISTMGLEARRDKLPATLSGGEMQRVSIARALLVEPRLVLADEPTGNLDSKTGDEVLALLRRVVDERGATLVLVTHDLRVASYADRMLVVRDGCVEDDLPGQGDRP